MRQQYNISVTVAESEQIERLRVAGYSVIDIMRVGVKICLNSVEEKKIKNNP